MATVRDFLETAGLDIPRGSRLDVVLREQEAAAREADTPLEVNLPHTVQVLRKVAAAKAVLDGAMNAPLASKIIRPDAALHALTIQPLHEALPELPEGMGPMERLKALRCMAHSGRFANSLTDTNVCAARTLMMRRLGLSQSMEDPPLLMLQSDIPRSEVWSVRGKPMLVITEPMTQLEPEELAGIMGVQLAAHMRQKHHGATVDVDGSTLVRALGSSKATANRIEEISDRIENAFAEILGHIGIDVEFVEKAPETEHFAYGIRAAGSVATLRAAQQKVSELRNKQITSLQTIMDGLAPMGDPSRQPVGEPPELGGMYKGAILGVVQYLLNGLRYGPNVHAPALSEQLGTLSTEDLPPLAPRVRSAAKMGYGEAQDWQPLEGYIAPLPGLAPLPADIPTPSQQRATAKKLHKALDEIEAQRARLHGTDAPSAERQ